MAGERRGNIISRQAGGKKARAVCMARARGNGINEQISQQCGGNGKAGIPSIMAIFRTFSAKNIFAAHLAAAWLQTVCHVW